MQPELTTPSRNALIHATQTNERLGHENLGFLSELHGFLPTIAPLRRFSGPFEAWDQLAAELPRLYSNLTLRRRVADLPILYADDEHLPDAHLLRAASFLGIVAHALHRVQPDVPTRTPDSIEVPWREVSRRLRRREPILSYIDLIVYN